MSTVSTLTIPKTQMFYCRASKINKRWQINGKVLSFECKKCSKGSNYFVLKLDPNCLLITTYHGDEKFTLIGKDKISSLCKSIYDLDGKDYLESIALENSKKKGYDLTNVTVHHNFTTYTIWPGSVSQFKFDVNDLIPGKMVSFMIKDNYMTVQDSGTAFLNHVLDSDIVAAGINPDECTSKRMAKQVESECGKLLEVLHVDINKVNEPKVINNNNNDDDDEAVTIGDDDDVEDFSPVTPVKRPKLSDLLSPKLCPKKRSKHHSSKELESCAKELTFE